MTQANVRRAVGVDFGGTFVKMAIVDEAGRVQAREQLSTETLRGPEPWLAAVEEAIRRMAGAAGVARESLMGVGIGVPGLVDYARGFVYNLTNVPGWTAVPLKELAERRWGCRVCVDNDVNAMALGECRYGAGRSYRHAVFVTLGTGVGGGLVLNGQLFRGAHSMAGEIGHMTIVKDGVRSPMGRGGLEQYVGNRRLVQRAVRALKKGRASSLRDAVGGRLEELTPKHIAEAAAAGDALAMEIFDFAADCLAAAFASVTYLLQPEAFIVGGGVAQSGRVLFEPLERHLKERLSPYFANRIVVRPAELGTDAGVIGTAALLWAG